MSLNREHLPPERDFLEAMENGNEAQVLRTGVLRTKHDHEVLWETPGWNDHVNKCVRRFRREAIDRARGLRDREIEHSQAVAEALCIEFII